MPGYWYVMLREFTIYTALCKLEDKRRANMNKYL